MLALVSANTKHLFVSNLHFSGGKKKVPAAAVLAASLFLVCQAGLLLFAKNAGSQFRVAYREMLGIVRAKENETRFVFSS